MRDLKKDLLGAIYASYKRIMLTAASESDSIILLISPKAIQESESAGDEYSDLLERWETARFIT